MASDNAIYLRVCKGCLRHKDYADFYELVDGLERRRRLCSECRRHKRIIPLHLTILQAAQDQKWLTSKPTKPDKKAERLARLERWQELEDYLWQKNPPLYEPLYGPWISPFLFSPVNGALLPTTPARPVKIDTVIKSPFEQTAPPLPKAPRMPQKVARPKAALPPRKVARPPGKPANMAPGPNI